jgi:two-component system sensor histidine kinase TctE
MRWKPASLKYQLVLALLAAGAVLVAASAFSAYRTALAAITTAYDRSLLAVAHVIAERVDIRSGKVFVEVPYFALDFFESDLRGRVYYKVSGLHGEFVSGFSDLPPLPAAVPRTDVYYSLAHFHDERFRGDPVRMVSLYQPVQDEAARGMALVQVAETLVSREALTRRIFLDTLARQLAVAALAAVLVLAVVWYAMRPLERMSAELEARKAGDLSPLAGEGAPSEVAPLVASMNAYVSRLKDLLDEQERFIADASHQMRTPLAVLRTQVDLARRESEPARVMETLEALSRSLADTIQVTNQLLSRARARHGLAVRRRSPVDLDAAVRQVCLDLAPAAVARGVDLAYEGTPTLLVYGDEGLLREAARNLLDNALRHTPAGGAITVRVDAADDGSALLEVEDTGPGIPAELWERAFEPFVRLDPAAGEGSGLGLAIVRDVVLAHGGEVTLGPGADGRGLKACVRLPGG